MCGLGARPADFMLKKKAQNETSVWAPVKVPRRRSYFQL